MKNALPLFAVFALFAGFMFMACPPGAEIADADAGVDAGAEVAEADAGAEVADAG